MAEKALFFHRLRSATFKKFLNMRFVLQYDAQSKKMVTAESVLKMCRPYDYLIINGLYSFYHTTLFEYDTVVVRFSMFNKTLILNG